MTYDLHVKNVSKCSNFILFNTFYFTKLFFSFQYELLNEIKGLKFSTFKDVENYINTFSYKGITSRQIYLVFIQSLIMNSIIYNQSVHYIFKENTLLVDNKNGFRPIALNTCFFTNSNLSINEIYINIVKNVHPYLACGIDKSKLQNCTFLDVKTIYGLYYLSKSILDIFKETDKEIKINIPKDYVENFESLFKNAITNQATLNVGLLIEKKHILKFQYFLYFGALPLSTTFKFEGEDKFKIFVNTKEEKEYVVSISFYLLKDNVNIIIN